MILVRFPIELPEIIGLEVRAFITYILGAVYLINIFFDISGIFSYYVIYSVITTKHDHYCMTYRSIFFLISLTFLSLTII
ncbi:MAG: hypothetical protein MJ000_00285 [Bacteroidales bacterium]|nr:hypothetical protein [Bacteroidales bacterium]